MRLNIQNLKKMLTVYLGDVCWFCYPSSNLIIAAVGNMKYSLAACKHLSFRSAGFVFLHLEQPFDFN